MQAGSESRAIAKGARWAIGAAMLFGLILRIFAAQGGLWLDEAWSVYQASHVAPMIGVFASINHDNNHHLNSLWLQLVGIDAPSLLMRGFAIACSTAAIGVAAAIMARRNAAAAICAAWLFALAPFMVLYGSEARGYAPVTLSILVAIKLVDDWLAAGGGAPPKWLPLIAVLGIFSHLMMIAALASIGIWVWLSLMQDRDWMKATHQTYLVLIPTAIAATTALLIVIGTAYSVAGGMAIGSYTPFSLVSFGSALSSLAGLVTGLGIYGDTGWSNMAGLVILLTILVFAGRGDMDKMLICGALVLLLPFAVLIVRPGNTGFARYFLPVAIGLLFFMADQFGQLCARKGRVANCIAGFIGIGLPLVALVQDFQLISNRRGDVALAITALSKESPLGGVVAAPQSRALALLDVAARQARYPLQNAGKNCARAPFLFILQTPDPSRGSLFPYCGAHWKSLASRTNIGPSGQSWVLYARQGLQSPKAAVNGPPPAR